MQPRELDGNPRPARPGYRVRLFGDRLGLLILVVATGIRIHAAVTARQLWDETQTTIKFAEAISFSPSHLNLPIRGRNHPALPSYVAKASAGLFGTTPFGYRAIHLMLGVGGLVIAYHIAGRQYGITAARWAMGLLAFNEYHIRVTTIATSHAPHLFLVGLAILAFLEFLRDPRPSLLYTTTAAVGIAFYSKEHSALLLPVFLVMLFFSNQRHWLRSPHLVLSGTLFGVLIVPDLLWNVLGSPTKEQVTYLDHFARVGGFGFSPYALMFFARDWTLSAYEVLLNRPLFDSLDEYSSMNGVLGLFLLAAVVLMSLKSRRADPGTRLLIAVFWWFVLFFCLITPGQTKRLDPVSWTWVDAVLYPATALSGALLADSLRLKKSILVFLAAVGMTVAVARMLGYWEKARLGVARNAQGPQGGLLTSHFVQYEVKAPLQL